MQEQSCLCRAAIPAVLQLPCTALQGDLWCAVAISWHAEQWVPPALAERKHLVHLCHMKGWVSVSAFLQPSFLVALTKDKWAGTGTHTLPCFYSRRAAVMYRSLLSEARVTKNFLAVYKGNKREGWMNPACSHPSACVLPRAKPPSVEMQPLKYNFTLKLEYLTAWESITYLEQFTPVQRTSE